MKFFNWFKENYWLTIILIAALFLRIYHINFQSIWLDEILSMNNSNPKLSMKQFYEGIMFWEFMPHMYFLILRFVFDIFGYSATVARLFSAIIGVFGVYSIYLFGKELINKRGGLIAAGLVCVNFFHISYSQEVRPYGMLFLFTVLSFYRMVIFIKKPSILNAIIFGLFTGLYLNCHFFGFITLFSQCLLLLFFLIKTSKENRNKFFRYCIVFGIVTLIIFSPSFEALLRVTEIKSFWLQKPGPEAFTSMFREFFGNSEMLISVINLLVIFYFINLFKEKNNNQNSNAIISNKVVFSFIILSTWLSVSLIIPLIRSYLDVPMILSRYFINILPVLILVISIGINFIKNDLIRIVVITYLVVFSILDLFVVKNYYNTVTKSQYRELSEEIIKRNPDKSKLVVFWSWIFPYFFQNESQIKIEGNSLDDYVNGMRSGSILNKSFWYADANSRPLQISPENQIYLDTNFILKEKLEYYDAWANYYVSKNQTIQVKKSGVKNALTLDMFSPINLNEKGYLILFENANLKTEPINLDNGNYELIINANSLPENPVNGENAHFKIKINDNEIANYYLSENKNKQSKKIVFSSKNNENNSFEIIFDNDIFENGKDRNAVIYSISIKKMAN
jgi:uncharacterized membrane protein